jgi:dienelactone hydrolase
MISQTLEYAVDGAKFVGYLVHDSQTRAKRPGILVCHDGTGLRDHAKARARMLADLGYVAFALDMYGQALESREHGIAVITGLIKQPRVLRKRARAALETLKAQASVDPHRTAAIGFCFGGLVALELARDGADLCCAVSFHGGLQQTTPTDENNVRCKLLICLGADDPFVSREQRAAFEDEMRSSNADWQMIIHGGARHGFTDQNVDATKFPGCAYHQTADERSWRAMGDLFDETMGRF